MWVIVSRLLGVGLPALVKQITDAQKQKLDAKTEQERIYADERIKTLEAKRDVILKSQENRAERFIRSLFALPFVVYIWKLVLWDKVLELGVTDPLSPTLEYILWTVLGGYFLDATLKSFRR